MTDSVLELIDCLFDMGVCVQEGIDWRCYMTFFPKNKECYCVWLSLYRN